MKAERVNELARAAGWRDTPTVRDAFAGFDLYSFAWLVSQDRLNEAALMIDDMAHDWATYAHRGPAGMVAACAEAVRAMKTAA